MSNERIQDDLLLFICGELAPERAAEVEGLLAQDAALAAEARRMEEALEAVRDQSKVQVSGDFNAALRARLEAELSSRPHARRLGGRRLALLEMAAAAAVLVVVLLAAGVLTPGRRQVVWADVASAMQQIDQFRVTAFVADNGRQVRLDVFYKSPHTWRAQADGTVQFVTPGGEKFYEVAKYLTIGNFTRIDYIVMTNVKFWDSLKPDQQKLFTEAMKQATAYERSLSEDLNDKSLEIMKKSGKVEVYTLTPAERQEFIKTLEPLYKQYEDRIGKANLDYAKSLK